MDNKERLSKDFYTIDLIHIVKSLWKRVWVIVLSGMLAAIVGFSVASYWIKPEYSSSIMLYVNNSSFSIGNTAFSISSSEITAAQSLVKTYGEILNNRTTLERVIEKSQVDCSWRQLSGMIDAAPSNGTEIMKVVVTSTDPYEAAKIANCIAEVLPVRISEIIDGASMEVIDSAVPNLSKVSPSITKYTAVGLIVGALIAVMVLVVLAMLDGTIHNEEYVLMICDYPILAKIPDLVTPGTKRYEYYSKNKTKSKDSGN